VSKFKLSQPRARAYLTATCFADSQLFLPYEDLPKAAKREFKVNGSIPCEGGGIPGEWCAGCRFGGRLETVDLEFEVDA
jgi:hypothetical protein